VRADPVKRSGARGDPALREADMGACTTAISASSDAFLPFAARAR
jgi:hypothetical protein